MKLSKNWLKTLFQTLGGVSKYALQEQENIRIKRSKRKHNRRRNYLARKSRQTGRG